MSNVVYLFKNAAKKSPAPQPSDRNVTKSYIEMELCVKMNRFQSSFDYIEKEILGGVPDIKATNILGNILYVFLENKLHDQKEGRFDGCSLLADLYAVMSKDNIVFNPSLGLNAANGDLRKSVKLILASTLDKVLTSQHYNVLRDDKAMAAVAEYVIDEGQNFIHVTRGVAPSHPHYRANILSFCRQMTNAPYEQEVASNNLFMHVRTALYKDVGQRVVTIDKAIPVAPSSL